jgi:hypothetical protein
MRALLAALCVSAALLACSSGDTADPIVTGDSSTESDAALDTEESIDVLGDAGSDAAPDLGVDATKTCAKDGDCPCGNICVAGSCAIDDCKKTACPTGRTCVCKNGILDVDGKTGDQWPKQDVVVRRRPMTAADDGGEVVVRDYHVHDATDQKAIHVTLADMTSGAMYARVKIQCVEIDHVYRDDAGASAGLHMDYIKVDGLLAGKPPADVLIEDANIHDGNVYSLVSDAAIATITIRRVVQSADGSFQIGGKFGSIGALLIDQSKDFHLAVLDTKIGKIVVTASPGVTGLDAWKDQIPIAYDKASCPTRALGSKETCG